MLSLRIGCNVEIHQSLVPSWSQTLNCIIGTHCFSDTVLWKWLFINPKFYHHLDNLIESLRFSSRLGKLWSDSKTLTLCSKEVHFCPSLEVARIMFFNGRERCCEKSTYRRILTVLTSNEGWLFLPCKSFVNPFYWKWVRARLSLSKIGWMTPECFSAVESIVESFVTFLRENRKAASRERGSLAEPSTHTFVTSKNRNNNATTGFESSCLMLR